MRLMDLVGNTPLIDIPHPNQKRVPIFAKLESANPSGSVKDRAAKAMLLKAMQIPGARDRTFIEATSGNTGIALAMMAAELGLKMEIAIPSNASPERKRILAAYGVTIHLTSPLEGTDGAQRFVAAWAAAEPHRYIHLDQYNNDANWKTHEETTGPEIWRQTQGKVTHFICGLGTTGTFGGISRFLKRHSVHCTSLQPDNPMHGLEGWKHLETALVPGIYDSTLADATLTIDTEDAFRCARAAARHLGLHISPSAAGNLVGALRLASTLDKGMVVTIITDGAAKYLEDAFWRNDDYLITNPFE